MSFAVTCLTGRFGIASAASPLPQSVALLPGQSTVQRRQFVSLAKASAYLRRAILILSVATLWGCQSVPSGPQDDLSWAKRQALLNQHKSYETSGRLSITVPGQSDAASFSLNVDHDDLALQLAGPLGLGAIRLELIDGQGRLISARHGDIEFDNTADDLTALLGYPVPMNAIRYWALGLPQPGGSAQIEMTSDGRRLSALNQGIWQVEFQDYQRVVTEAGNPGSSRDLPRRVLLTGPDVTILMVFRRWQF